MDPADIEAIAAAVVARMPSPPPYREVLNVDEAVTFVGCPSVRAFGHWCRRYGVRPCARYRYRTMTLKKGLEREARGSYDSDAHRQKTAA